MNILGHQILNKLTEDIKKTQQIKANIDDINITLSSFNDVDSLCDRILDISILFGSSDVLIKDLITKTAYDEICRLVESALNRRLNALLEEAKKYHINE